MQCTVHGSMLKGWFRAGDDDLPKSVFTDKLIRIFILFNFQSEIKLNKSNQHHPRNNKHHMQFSTQKSLSEKKILISDMFSCFCSITDMGVYIF